MADKFSFEEGGVPKVKTIVLDSVEALEKALRSFSTHTEIEKRIHDVIVRVMDFAGGSEYLARGATEQFVLKQIAYKTERRGTFTLYYIKLDGKTVELP